MARPRDTRASSREVSSSGWPSAARSPQDPAILLLDEPLSALDGPLRRQLRAELVAAIREWDKSTVLVTLDLSEAYELAEQIVVYQRGRVLQSARRRDSLMRPTSEAVARILGVRNILRGTVERVTPERIYLDWRGLTLEPVHPPGYSDGLRPGQHVGFVVRPELIRLIRKDRPGPDPARHRNLFEAAIVRDRDLGTARVLEVSLEAPGPPDGRDSDLEIELSPLVYEMLDVAHNRRWQLSVQPAGIHVLRDERGSSADSAATAEARGHAAPVDGITRHERHAPSAAAFTGAAVGVLGGLIGLGGAEFRLPVLVGYFRYRLVRAISLNLAVSLLTVLVSAATRVLLAGQVPDLTAAPVAIAMMLGGMAGAALGARWLARVSEHRLHRAVQILLIGIGLLLIAESLGRWESSGLPLAAAGRATVGLCAGALIGIVSTLLGVAGGELIIPTLVLAFGVPIKAAGTWSLLISVPTIIVGLARHRAQGAFAGLRDVRSLIVPMAVGTVVGSVGGGMLVRYVPSHAVKLLLGAILIASALKVFAVDRHGGAR